MQNRYRQPDFPIIHRRSWNLLRNVKKENNAIERDLYTKFDVKRILRDLNEKVYWPA